MELRIAGVEPESVVDGPGIRYVIFAQGCEHFCPGCQNPESHDQVGGKLVKMADLLAKITRGRLLQGVTFSGGEPFLQAKIFAILGQELKRKNLDIVTFTGYIFEELLEKAIEKPEYLELLKVTDWLIDGPYIASQRDLQLLYRGSANQRIIDVAQSLQYQRTVVSLG